MKIPIEMLKEIRESGYDKRLVYNYIRELLNSEKQIKENNNLELIDNYLLENNLQEPSAEIQMAAEILDNYLLDKRFIRELLDSDKEIQENNNLDLVDNYLLDKNLQEPAPEMLMAAELLDDYLLDKRFMRELENEEYDAA